MKRLSLAEASAVLIGTQIGAGILGLPYAIKEAGPILGVFAIIITGILTLITALFVLEIAAQNQGKQLSKLAEIYLGKTGGVLMFLSISTLSYGALIAYISGSGEALNSLFGINKSIGSILFWIIASFIILQGLKVSGKAELFLNFFLMGALIIVIALIFPHLKSENIGYLNISGISKAIGVSIFAYVSHMVVPEMLRGLNDVKTTSKAVLIGYIIPMMAYSIFAFSFVAVFGLNTPELATQGLVEFYGRLGLIVGTLLPLLAIITSYIGIGLAQMDNWRDYVGISKRKAWLLTVAPPLLIYFLGLNSFVNALWLAGTFGGVIYAGVLPTLMYIKMRRYHSKLHLNIHHSFAYLSALAFLLLFLYSIKSI
jgi:amino acid permease